MTSLCLVAGGTGGHIFPAVAFGQWVRDHHPSVGVTFVCGCRPLEREIYASQGIDPLVLPMSGSPFGVPGFTRKARRWKEMMLSMGTFRRFLRSAAPDCCVLFGGYPSFIPLLMNSLKGVPTVLHEQNSVAGMVTRIAAKMKKPVASGWEECTPLPPGSYTRTGVPIRTVTRKEPRVAWDSMKLGIPFPERKKIGILGGSLMSEALIQLTKHVIREEGLQGCTLLVLGERGAHDIPPYESEEDGSVVYIGRQWDMSNVFSLLHGAITRGGASTLSELAAWRIPSIVVPWPQASDNHQEKNAISFVRENGGAIWKEGEPAELLRTHILDIIQGDGPRMRENATGDESERLWRLISSNTERENTRRG